MHFADMDKVTQIARGPHVRAIGWLSAAHPFPVGHVEPAVLTRIRAFALRSERSAVALNWPFAGGAHECELCGMARASGNFAVPCGDILFVCPEMIAHYVAEHDYLPSREFLAAIMASDLPGTDAYARAVSAWSAD